jgi:hypothetical protein
MRRIAGATSNPFTSDLFAAAPSAGGGGGGEGAGGGGGGGRNGGGEASTAEDLFNFRRRFGKVCI